MKVIGLTGGTGSGKSVVSKWLGQQGAYIIDADKIAHDIIEKGKPAYQEIIDFFGKEILDEDGNIIRKKLGSIVFQNKEQLAFLNNCTHKYIREEIQKKIQQFQEVEGKKFIILDAPLLFEAELQKSCDEIWVVSADEEVRANRIVERDGLTYQQAKERIASQKSQKEYESFADFVIDNSLNLDYLLKQLKEKVSSFSLN